MPELGDHRAARPAGRGHMRASHADREQVLGTLKEAFVQGRLTRDEFDSRVGHALASRTHADLAALTADLPAGPPTVQPTPKVIQARPVNTTVRNGARVIAATTALTGGVWAGALVSPADSQALGLLVWSFTVLWLGIVTLVGSVMLESLRPRRSGRQLPPASGPGGQAFGRAVSADPARPLRPANDGRRHAETSWRPTPLPLVPLPFRSGPAGESSSRFP
jgi:hypothetical protein